MTIDTLLRRLESVRPRGQGRWVAKCPAHADRSPSLSICESEGRILLHDFGGCPPSDIVAAIGLELKDLFTDAPLPRGQRPAPKPRRVNRRRIALDFELHGIMLQDRAQAVLNSASGLDCSEWSDDDFDAGLAAVGRAYDDVMRAGILFSVADSQRERAFAEETRR